MHARPPAAATRDYNINLDLNLAEYASVSRFAHDLFQNFLQCNDFCFVRDPSGSQGGPGGDSRGSNGIPSNPGGPGPGNKNAWTNNRSFLATNKQKTPHFVRRKRDAKTAHFVPHCSSPGAARTFAAPAHPSHARF